MLRQKAHTRDGALSNGSGRWTDSSTRRQFWVNKVSVAEYAIATAEIASESHSARFAGS